MRKYSKPLNYGNVFTKYNIVAVDSVRYVEAFSFFFFILLFPEYFPVLGEDAKRPSADCKRPSVRFQSFLSGKDYFLIPSSSLAIIAR